METSYREMVLTKNKSGGLLLLKVLLLLLVTMAGCRRSEVYYGIDDFRKVPKTDAHFHYLTRDTGIMVLVGELNFRLLTPVWEGEEVSIDTQMAIASSIHKQYPERYAYLATFPTTGIRDPDFAPATIQYIRARMAEGASGVKIWKNIGMVLRWPDGRYVMVDDPVFAPVFEYLQQEHIPVTGHLGEPRNCWLPLDQMTDRGDAAYYEAHPQYHMFLHPEVPSYELQLRARDKLLARYPSIDFTGAHLGSMEWNLGEVAARLDRFPNFNVDLAARMGHVMRQSAINREKVREFFINYQDRILYGTDQEAHDQEDVSPSDRKNQLRQTWFRDWLYLATDSVVSGVRGLQLPASVLDKIYQENASRFYK
ncbi:MAG: amidohydrolase family protein [Bacteroidales bacterium]